MQPLIRRPIDPIQELEKLKGIEYKNRTESSDLYPIVGDFMESLEKIIFMKPMERYCLSLSFEDKEILQRARESIKVYAFDVLSRDIDLINQLEWQDRSLWSSICWQRTLLEIFNRTFKDVVEPFDMRCVDGCIAYYAEWNPLRMDLAIPPHIPADHWWWHLNKPNETTNWEIYNREVARYATSRLQEEKDSFDLRPIGEALDQG